ncbi:MAG: DUF6259 domain-containing protein [Planctomycetia bacterium]|nr:DUF6259 domain-containing protein [Planctomycetia bacterium]
MRFFLPIFCLLFSATPLEAGVTLAVRDVSPSGIAIVSLNARTLAAVETCEAEEIRDVEVRWNGERVLSQYVNRNKLVLQFSESQIAASRTEVLKLTIIPVFSGETSFLPRRISRFQAEIPPSKPEYRIVQDVGQSAGFPTEISFGKTGRVLNTHQFYDRLYNPGDSRPLSQDKKAELTLLSEGTICSVVRQEMRFARENGSLPADSPRAVYDWYYFHTVPGLIYVESQIKQETPQAWQELHFLELHIPDGSFSQGYGKTHEGWISQTFSGTKKQTQFTDYGALSDGKNYLAFSSGCGMYDGLRTFGPYLMANLSEAWTVWDTLEKVQSVWLAVKSLETPEQFHTFVEKYLSQTMPAFVQLSVPHAEKTDWRKNLADSLLLSGIDVPQERRLLLQSRDLALLLEKREQTLRLLSLVDCRTGTVFTGNAPQKLFTLTVREVATKKTQKFSSDSLWKKVEITSRGTVTEVRFQSPEMAGAENLEVTLHFEADPAQDGIRMTWDGKAGSDAISLHHFSAGMLECGMFGPKMVVYHPESTGVLIRHPFQQKLTKIRDYPNGWCVMPWMAVWDETENVGIYTAMHDSQGSLKQLELQSSPVERTLRMAFSHPLPDKTIPNNTMQSPGALVWQSFSGDWYDAAVIYRDWVRRHACWFPKLGENGRADTPRWMKELSLWVIENGEPEAVKERMKKFQAAFGVPCAVHWYNWHITPFDNDYPHYLPRDGFRDAVVELQKEKQIYVMPYINARLWDTRDRGVEDYQFTSVALPAVTKQEDGTPVVESYGSRESDGSPVQLGVMCPATRLWKEKVHANVSMLMNDQCVQGVYLDQTSAASPVECMDTTHGHPLGGGSWWQRAYAEMLNQIRNDVLQNGNEFSPAEERMLTSECNAEVYANLFDGFLTWHLQSDNAVPAFSVVYGGTVQMFGRSYEGDNTAIRMKAAQQLVFGEQIGWFGSDIVNRSELMGYLRPMVQFRKQIAPYFYQGEMARPVAFLQPLPQISGDWRWSQKLTPVTMEVVQTSTWRIVRYPNLTTGERNWERGEVDRVILLFTNFSDHSVKNRIRVNWKELGFSEETNVRLEKISPDGTRRELPVDFLNQEIEFPAMETWGVEIVEK